MVTKTIVVALAVTMAACAARTQNGAASSVAASPVAFEQYSTFSFGFADPPEPGYRVTARSLEVQRRLRGIVKSRLERAGYVESPRASELVVKLATGMVPPDRTQPGCAKVGTHAGAGLHWRARVRCADRVDDLAGLRLRRNRCCADRRRPPRAWRGPHAERIAQRSKKASRDQLVLPSIAGACAALSAAGFAAPTSIRNV